MLLARQWMLALGYALLAGLAVTLTRFDGGVAFLWGASALLIAALVRTSAAQLVGAAAGLRRRRRRGDRVSSGSAGRSRPFMLVANIGEAVIAALSG